MANASPELLSELLAHLAQGQGEELVEANPILLDPQILVLFESAARRAKEGRQPEETDSLALAAWFLREQKWAYEQDKAIAALRAQSSTRAPDRDDLIRAQEDLAAALVQCESAEQTLRALAAHQPALLSEGVDEAILSEVADVRGESSIVDLEKMAQRLLVGRDFIRVVRTYGFAAARMHVRQMQRLQISNLFIVLMGPISSRDRRAVITEHAGVLATQECVSQFGAMIEMLQQQGEPDRDMDARARGLRIFLRALRGSGLAEALELPEVQWMLSDDGELRLRDSRELVLRRAVRRLHNASTDDERLLILYAYRELLFDEAMALYYDDFTSQVSSPAKSEVVDMLRAERELLYRCQEIGVEAAMESVAKDPTIAV